MSAAGAVMSDCASPLVPQTKWFTPAQGFPNFTMSPQYGLTRFSGFVNADQSVEVSSVFNGELSAVMAQRVYSVTLYYCFSSSV